MVKINRRQALKYGGITTISGLAGCLGGASSGNDDYPNQNITLMSNYPEGSGTYALAMKLSSVISEQQGVNVEVEAVGGGAGLRGLGELRGRPNDGYTFSTVYTPSQPLAALINDPGFDVTNLTGITDAGHYTFQLIADPSRDFDDFAEVKERYNSGEFDSIGGLGRGQSFHIACAVAREEIGWDWNNLVSFDGSRDSVRGTAAGEVPVSTASVNASSAAVKEGNVDAIANFYSEGDQYSEAPAWVDDLGLPDIDYIAKISYGFLAPPNLDEDIQSQAVDMFKQAIESDTMRQWAENANLHNGVENGGDEFTDMMKESQEKIQNQVDLDKITE
jgi:tripartite-type tricarboxylate transporter receptor subunit TctC